MIKKFLAIFIIIFSVGWLANDVYSSYSNLESPRFLPSFVSSERNSPSDWVKEDNIFVFDDKIVINIEDATWTAYADTNSMDPFIDEGANGLEITPKNPEDLQVGDVISYISTLDNAFVAHRIVKIGYDGDGWYAITKGDNNSIADPEKIRFNQIKYVLIGVIY